MLNHKPVKLAFNTFDPPRVLKNSNPIIFLHGITASKEYWNDIPQKIADATNRKVYTLDARNHGDSEWGDGMNFEVNAVDLIHFLDEIDAKKAILVGHSMGGFTSMLTALLMPERVEKLCVEDMTLSEIPKVHANLVLVYLSKAEEAINKIPLGASMEDAKKFIGNFIYESVPENLKAFVTPNSHDHRILLKANTDGTFSYKSNYKAIRKALEEHVNSSYKVTGVYDGPACFIYGMKSPFKVNEDEVSIRSRFPKADFIGVEDAYHTIHRDNPVQFLRELINFINKSY